MNLCPRCRRVHRGLCGIPAGVTLGFGARLGTVKEAAQVGTTPARKVRPAKLGKNALEGLLAWGLREQVKVKGLLDGTPPELEGYDLLLDRYGKLEGTIAQIRLQLAVRGNL